MSVGSHVVSPATLFDPERAGDLDVPLEMRMGDALDTGALVLEGDREKVERFAGRFPLPEPAAVPAWPPPAARRAQPAARRP